MRCVTEVLSFNLIYNLCIYYEKQNSYDKTELTFQPTLVFLRQSEEFLWQFIHKNLFHWWNLLRVINSTKSLKAVPTCGKHCSVFVDQLRGVFCIMIFKMSSHQTLDILSTAANQEVK